MDRKSFKERTKIRRDCCCCQVRQIHSTFSDCGLWDTSGIYSCTSNGALRLTKPNGDDTPDFQLAILPMRLAEWRLTSDCKAFAYVGDEVEASVWDSERCFVGASTGQAASVNDAKKRKRSEQLLPGETWRAKNVSSLTFLS